MLKNVSSCNERYRKDRDDYEDFERKRKKKKHKRHRSQDVSDLEVIDSRGTPDPSEVIEIHGSSSEEERQDEAGGKDRKKHSHRHKKHHRDVLPVHKYEAPQSSENYNSSKMQEKIDDELRRRGYKHKRDDRDKFSDREYREHNNHVLLENVRIKEENLDKNARSRVRSKIEDRQEKHSSRRHNKNIKDYTRGRPFTDKEDRGQSGSMHDSREKKRVKEDHPRERTKIKDEHSRDKTSANSRERTKIKDEHSHDKTRANSRERTKVKEEHSHDKTSVKDEHSRNKSRVKVKREESREHVRSPVRVKRERNRDDDRRNGTGGRSGQRGESGAERSGRHRPNENADNEEYDWGGVASNSDASETAAGGGAEKDKPDFKLSGKLAEETNTMNGVVIKYSEPPESRMPKKRWRLYQFKGQEALPTLYIHRQSAYLIGRDRKIADLPVDHPSCSKQHAALQYRLVSYERLNGTTGKQIRLYVIDLESANGTFINGKKIDPKKYVELLEKDVIKFGFSSREYVLLHEQSKDDENSEDD